jgi:hypothetical protein
VRLSVLKYVFATRCTSAAVTFWYSASSRLASETSSRITAAWPMVSALLCTVWFPKTSSEMS